MIFKRLLFLLTALSVSGCESTMPYAWVATEVKASPRYVLRQQNNGDAVTQGLELEAKYRLSDLWAEAPRIDVRAMGAPEGANTGPADRVDLVLVSQ